MTRHSLVQRQIPIGIGIETVFWIHLLAALSHIQIGFYFPISSTSNKRVVSSKMADAAEQIVKQAAENVTETLSGAKIPATPEGAAVAYGSLIFMAMLPIFFGAFRSVKHQTDQKVSYETIQIGGHSHTKCHYHVITIHQSIHPHPPSTHLQF